MLHKPIFGDAYLHNLSSLVLSNMTVWHKEMRFSRDRDLTGFVMCYTCIRIKFTTIIPLCFLFFLFTNKDLKCMNLSNVRL